MIQRIQTVWLFLIAVLSGCLFFLPAVENESAYVFPCEWIVDIEIGLTIVLSVAAVFLYKNRPLQIKLCYGILALQVLLYITLFFVVQEAFRGTETSVVWLYPVVFPLIVIVLDLLAIRRIKKDEKLVRSLDRLR
jgi:hypothetical protein